MMKLRYLYFYLIGLLLFGGGCQRPTLLDFALEYAGENRSELEKVLEHYRGDSLKYRAAVFLIENAPYHYTWSGPQIDNWRQGYRWMIESGMSSKQVKRQLTEIAGVPDSRNWRKENDARTLTAGFLIRHIDYVFAVWEKRPWASYYSFEDFCEFVLPYRVGREPAEFWQEAYTARYGRLCDSLCAVNPDVVFVASALNDHLRAEQNWYASSDLSFVEYGALQLLDERFGGCREVSGFNVALFRALGIPCGIDMVVQNPHRMGSHCWTFMVDTNGCGLPYIWSYYNINREKRMEEKYGKVYREYFSLQQEQFAVCHYDDDIPDLLKNPFLRDVSEEYFGKDSAVVALYETLDREKWCYLAVFNNAGWSPVAVARTDRGKAVFESIDTAIVYLPVYYAGGQLQAAGDPFIYDAAYRVIPIVGDKDRFQDMHLLKKYTATALDQLLLDLMVGGVFEGAGSPDFKDAVVLHRIPQVPLPDSNWVEVHCPLKFNYLRYRGPEYSNSCIAEAMFFDPAGKLIRGEAFGTPAADNGRTWDCTKVYDGSKHTYFAAQDPCTSWAGLRLAEPVRVSRICYIPRNDDNFVKPGDLYELLYWYRGQWHSMGQQVAREYALDYRQVPAGCLYWLRNLTEGKEERIFTYVQGKQVWW